MNGSWELYFIVDFLFHGRGHEDSLLTEESELLSSALQKHGVVGLYYNSYISRFSDRTKAEDNFLGLLEEKLRRWRLFGLKSLAELVRIQKSFDEAGVSLLHLKGPTLSQRLYGDPLLRSFGDLDVLVKEDQARYAIDTLVKLGYECSSPTLVSYFYDDMIPPVGVYHLEFSKNGVSIELHWSLSRHAHGRLANVGELFNRSQSVVIGGRELRTLSDSDHLAFLDFHSAGHCCSRLKWVVDSFELSKAIGKGGRSSSSYRLLNEGLAEALGMVVEGARKFPWHVKLAIRLCMRQLNQLSNKPSAIRVVLERSLVMFLLSPGCKGRVLYLCRLMYRPNAIGTIRLKGRWEFAYLVIGPLHWAYGKLSGRKY